VVADAAVVIGEDLDLALAAFAYGGPLRRALAALKYSGSSRLAPIVAELSAPTLRRLLVITGPAVLVPVPVHAARARQRGYNQAALIARELARRSGLPVADALRRTRPTARQHRLDRASRLRNLRSAFEADGHAPSTAVVVDDIITTSATLESCARVLRGAGSTSVYGLAVAREV
jgi:ComF family protein